MQPLPPGFVGEAAGDAFSVARAELAPELRALGVFAPDAIERLAAAWEPLAGGRGGSGVIALAHGQLAARELRRGGLLAGWLPASFLGPGRVFAELRVAHSLHAAGAPLPAPAFAIARRTARGLWRCMIASERVPARSLLGWLRAASAEERARSLEAAARAARALHEHGGRHADLNASNVLVRLDGADARAWIVDLDRARIAAPVPARRRAAELARLFRSLAKHAPSAQPSAGERDAFVAAYCAGDAALERSLRWWLRRERMRSALHALHYARR